MTVLTKEQVEAIPELRKQGKTTKEIAEKYGVHISSIRRWYRELRKAGWDIPKGQKGRPAIKLSQGN